MKNVKSLKYIWSNGLEHEFESLRKYGIFTWNNPNALLIKQALKATP